MSAKAKGPVAPLFLDLKAAAEVTGVAPNTLLRAIHSGRLKAKKTSSTGGKTLVRVRDLEAWFESLVDA